MSLTEKFEQFMAMVDWEELTIGEKEALYEATYGAPNEDGVPFRVISNDEDETTRIEYTANEEAQIVLHQSALKKFRKWLEDTYMDGEVGQVYLAVVSEREKDEAEESSTIRYEYEIKRSVLADLRKYFSPYSIAEDVMISERSATFITDFVVYDNKDNLRVVIEVKPYDYISTETFKKLFGQIINRNSKIIYILTDGYTAVSSTASLERVKLYPSLKYLLVIVASQLIAKEAESSKIEDAKSVLKRAIENTRTGRLQKHKNKQKNLIGFVDSLQEEDIKYNTQNEYCFLRDERETELFKLILGTYNLDYIVRFSSSRSLHTILDKGKAGMCSLVCMNDPSEKDYADGYINKKKTLDNSSDTFIISGCTEDKEADLTMWRLYGDDAKGICTKFHIDQKHDLEKLGFYLAPISYATSKNFHYELKVIRSIHEAFKKLGWKFVFRKWDIWKHFFKKHIYAIEEEIRLLYSPKLAGAYKPESEWFVDERTSIYSESKLFELNQASPFPLSINKVILGTRFPSKKDNVKQYNKRFLNLPIQLFIQQEQEVVSICEIEDYR